MVVCLTLLLFVTGLWAQSNQGVPVLTKEQMKEVKKQAKQLKKEGWTVAEGEKSLDEQLADCQRYNNDPHYIVASASQVSASYRLGYTAVRAKALRAIAARIQTMISSETDLVRTNQQQDDGSIDSQSAFKTKIKSVSQEVLSEAFPVLVISRQLPDGTCEIQAHLAIAAE